MSADVRDDAATVRAVILACQPIGQKRFLDVLARLEAAAADSMSRESAQALIAESNRWQRAYDEKCNELAAAAARTEALEAALREALSEAHKYACGCDRPGNPSACIHSERFAALAAGDAETPR